jgi:ubiquinone/menaquinone biosynthesis C-methylase UbiE
VRFQVAELQNLPFQDNAFSHVCCISVLEHLHPNELLRVLEEFSRVLIPGGICFLSVDVSLEIRSDATFTLSKIKEFVLNLERKGLMPLYDIALQEDTSSLLRTDYYRSRDADYLPWTNCSQSSIYHRARHWLKTRVLRRGFFESLALAVFVCRKEK